MRELFIVTIIAMGIFFICGIVYQIFHHRKNPVTRYLCPDCGQRDCVCHKE